MTARLKRMDNPKYSRNGHVCFRRLYFELEDGGWAATDLVPSFRNYKWWEPVIKSGIGTEIGGVFLKDGYRDKINADSQVYILQEALVKQSPPIEDFQPRTYNIPSFTNPAKKYEITYIYGIPQCSCQDFKYRSGRGGCKHIKELEKQKAKERHLAQEALPKLF